MTKAAQRNHNDAKDRRLYSLTRKQVGARLGVSVRRVRDLELGGALRFRIDAKGVHRFAAADVEALAAKRGDIRSSSRHGDTESEQAAQVFERLAEGKELVEIVTALRVHPDVVLELAAKFEKMKATPSGVAFCVKPGCNSPARFCGECNRAARASS